MKKLIWLCSISYLIVLCILWASPYWPRPVWWLANLYQMAPLWVLYYPLGVLFMMALALREKRILAVHILSFAVIIFCIMGFNIPFSAHMRTQGHKPVPSEVEGNTKTQGCIRIMSCNLGANFNADLLADFISKTQPDIIAFQEVYAEHQDALEAMLSRGKWNLAFQQYLGIVSRLKIKKVDVKDRNIAGGWGGLAVRYELEGAMGPVNFFNVHLETPRSGLEAVIDKKLGGLSEVKKVMELQERESAILSQWILSHKKVLIAGDFNMREVNPLYRNYWARFTNTFLKTGFGFGYTYYTSWHGVRIDRVLYDNSWKAIHSEVGPDIGTEHRPVVADVEFTGTSSNQAQSEEPEEHTGTALKIEHNAGSDGASASVQLELWNIEDYPIASFAYMVPEEIPLGMRVKTMYNDWIDLKETAVSQLINDGKWHKIQIDVRTAVKGVLPAVKYLTEIQFYMPENKHQNDIFWIDDFKIGGD